MFQSRTRLIPSSPTPPKLPKNRFSPQASRGADPEGGAGALAAGTGGTPFAYFATEPGAALFMCPGSRLFSLQTLTNGHASEETMRRAASNGIISTVSVNLSAPPQFIALDGVGNLYVSIQGCLIQRFGVHGGVTTVASAAENRNERSVSRAWDGMAAAIVPSHCRIVAAWSFVIAFPV